MSSSNSICAVIAVLFLSVGLSAQNILNVPAQYPTIQAAYNAAANGDKILVASGTFVGNVALGQKPIILEGAGPNLTTVQGVGGPAISGSSLPRNTIIRSLRVTGGSLGGIYLDSSSATIENCLIEGNTSTLGGGGVRGSSSSLLLIDCVIRQNSSTLRGGGLDLDRGQVIGCTIVANSAPNGAGIDTGNDTALVDCLIINNTGTSSSMRIAGGASSLKNCTLAGNSGAIIDMNGSPNVDAQNCIIWGNTPPTPSPTDFVFMYSDVEGLGGGFDGNIDIDPLFVNPAMGDFGLLSTSPCKNSGDPMSAPNPDGSIVDMGEVAGHLHLGGAAQGNVGVAPVGNNGVVETLTIAGSFAGDIGRRVVRDVGTPLTISVADPVGFPSASPFALAMSFSAPSTADTTFFASIGEFAFSLSSFTVLVVDGFGGPSLIGPAFTPWSLSLVPPFPVIGVLQALYWRGGAFSQLRTTNAILLQVK